MPTPPIIPLYTTHEGIISASTLHAFSLISSSGDEPPEAEKRDMDYNMVYSSHVYDSTHKERKTNSVEPDTHVYDLPGSPPHHQRTNEVNIAQTQLPEPGLATSNPNSLPQGQCYIMTINKAYAST